MNVVERVLKRNLYTIMTVNLPLFLRKEKLMLCLSREGCKQSIMLELKKLSIYFMDLEKAFDRCEGKCWNGQ